VNHAASQEVDRKEVDCQEVDKEVDRKEVDCQEDDKEVDGQEVDGQAGHREEVDGQEEHGQEVDGQAGHREEVDGQEEHGQEVDGEEEHVQEALVGRMAGWREGGPAPPFLRLGRGMAQLGVLSSAARVPSLVSRRSSVNVSS
jgi:hypothetical protein